MHTIVRNGSWRLVMSRSCWGHETGQISNFDVTMCKRFAGQSAVPLTLELSGQHELALYRRV